MNKKLKNRSFFISYKRETGSLAAESIYDFLKSNFPKVFLDKRELVSGEFEPQIMNSIIKSQYFILVLSDGLFEKDGWIYKEIELALDRNKTIIPICVNNKFTDYYANSNIPKKFLQIKDYEGVEFVNKVPSDGELRSLLNKISGIYYKDLSSFLESYIHNCFYTLPTSKLINCIYARGVKDGFEIKSLIDDFNKLYIDKKVYKYRNTNISDRVNNFINSIFQNKQKDCFLMGNAGCGKSTLLFHTFIELISQLRDKKIIPIFVDMNTITDSNSLEEAIIGALSCYLDVKNLDDVIRWINDSGYSFLFLLDSLDECMIENPFKQILGLKKLESFSSFQENRIKVCIGFRSGLRDFINESYSANYIKYFVKDFDKYDVKAYLNSLLNMRKIDSEQIPSIMHSIELLYGVTDEKINPFMLSMLMRPYVNTKDSNLNSQVDFGDKFIDLILISVRALFSDINSNRENDRNPDLPFDETFQLIGMHGTIKNNSENFFSEFNIFYNPSEEIFKKQVDDLYKGTYLVSPEHKYYQKIFSDFYSAMYVYENFEITNEFSNKFRKIISNYWKTKNYKELFEFIALIADYKINKDGKIDNYIETRIDAILTRMIDGLDVEGTKIIMDEDVLFYNISCMLNALKKYSSRKIMKDALPIEINATYDSKGLTIFILKKYFEHLITRHNINFGYFYNVITELNNYDAVILAFKEMIKNNNFCSQYEEEFFNMLSIFRDSYLFCNYYGKKDILTCCYPKEINVVDMNKIYKLAVNFKNVIDMNLREVLNASFYVNDEIFDGNTVPYEKVNDRIKQKYNYFPSIYNIELFTSNESKIYPTGEFKVVTKEDNLLFYDSNDNFSIRVLNVGEKSYSSNNDLLNLEKVQSLFICSDSTNILKPLLSNKENFLTLEISENIEIIDENSFYKSYSLRNVLLPNSIKEIRPFAFCHCDALEHILLPDSVEFIGESAFEDCSVISEIIIPKNTKILGNYLFEQCSSLANIDFQYNDYIELSEGIFKGCHSIKTIESLNLSPKIDNIPKICFSSMEKLRIADLSIFKKLKKIDNYCFYECVNLDTVIFPKNIEEVGLALFVDCNSLKKVIFQSLPKILSNNVFAGLNHEVEIIIFDQSYPIRSNDEFYKILNDNFIGMYHLINDRYESNIAFEIKEDGTYNLGYSFNKNNQGFFELNSSYFDNIGIKISSFMIGGIGNSNFVTDVILDKNLIESAEWMFEDCPSLFNVKLDSTRIETLEKHMFENCDALEEVSLPSSLRIIKEYAFEGCSNLKKVYFAESGQDVVNGVLSIPKYVKQIKKYAFRGCSSINEVISYDTTNIDDDAFADSGVKNITIITIGEKNS